MSAENAETCARTTHTILHRAHETAPSRGRFMNSLLQLPIARHLGLCSRLPFRRAVQYACAGRCGARPDLAHAWRCGDLEPMNIAGSPGSFMGSPLQSPNTHHCGLCSPMGGTALRPIVSGRPFVPAARGRFLGALLRQAPRHTIKYVCIGRAASGSGYWPGWSW